jgi:hypothetical protein
VAVHNPVHVVTNEEDGKRDAQVACRVLHESGVGGIGKVLRSGKDCSNQDADSHKYQQQMDDHVIVHREARV